ncbi:MAG: hypothetical protein AAGJ97_06225 [Planctomycetota bacterium]
MTATDQPPPPDADAAGGSSTPSPYDRIRADLAGIKKLREFEAALLRQIHESIDRLEEDHG